MDWLEAQGIEILSADLPEGIAAQYYVRWRQIIMADDLTARQRATLLPRLKTEVVARMDRAMSRRKGLP